MTNDQNHYSSNFSFISLDWMGESTIGFVEPACWSHKYNGRFAKWMVERMMCNMTHSLILMF